MYSDGKHLRFASARWKAKLYIRPCWSSAFGRKQPP